MTHHHQLGRRLWRIAYLIGFTAGTLVAMATPNMNWVLAAALVGVTVAYGDLIAAYLVAKLLGPPEQDDYTPTRIRDDG